MTVATLKFANMIDLEKALGDSKSLKLTLNTIARRAGENVIAIDYHDNEIAVFDYARGEITLSTAGWTTYTTVGRLSQIASDNGIGYVSISKGVAIFHDNNKSWHLLGEDGECAPVTVKLSTGLANDRGDMTRALDMSNNDTLAAWGVMCDMLPELRAASVEFLTKKNEELAWMSWVEPRSEKFAVEVVREFIKKNRKRIGYKKIDGVNVEEIAQRLNQLEEI